MKKYTMGIIARKNLQIDIRASSQDRKVYLWSLTQKLRVFWKTTRQPNVLVRIHLCIPPSLCLRVLRRGARDSTKHPWHVTDDICDHENVVPVMIITGRDVHPATAR